jgi:hypothetical protein
VADQAYGGADGNRDARWRDDDLDVTPPWAQRWTMPQGGAETPAPGRTGQQSSTPIPRSQMPIPTSQIPPPISNVLSPPSESNHNAPRGSASSGSMRLRPAGPNAAPPNAPAPPPAAPAPNGVGKPETPPPPPSGPSIDVFADTLAHRWPPPNYDAPPAVPLPSPEAPLNPTPHEHLSTGGVPRRSGHDTTMPWSLRLSMPWSLRGRAHDDRDRLTTFGMAAYGLGLSVFAGVLLLTLAVFAMAGYATMDMIIGVIIAAGGLGCGAVALLYAGRDPHTPNRVAALAVGGLAVLLPPLWVVIWFQVLG